MRVHVQIKLFASLGRLRPANADHYPIEPGTRVAGLRDALGIDPAQVKLIFVNGVRAEADQLLKEGDRIGFFPPVGGG